MNITFLKETVQKVFHRICVSVSGWKRQRKFSARENALAASVALMLLWFALGTTTTLAWFTDTTPAVRNSFAIGELKLDVRFKNDRMEEWMPLEESTEVFYDQALYEPGYTQVVYIRIENVGDVDFNYKLSVDKFNAIDSTNVYGMTLHLPKYLRFGTIFGASEEKMTREAARQFASTEMEFLHLNQYSQMDPETVKPGDVRYAALAVHMPEETDNEANYRTGMNPPAVHLGITVYAQQAGTPMQK